jgi:energy-coupling factor transporter ATP-binding protein EcfA2
LSLKPEPVLKIEDLSFGYKAGEELFSCEEFSFYNAEAVAVTGDSGCGKTSFLYCIAGIIPKVRKGEFKGKIIFKGEDLTFKPIFETAQNIGMVFQDPDMQLFFDRIEEDIAFGLENLCIPRDEILRRLRETARLLNIENLMHRSSRELSGGHKRLAALATVLAMNPDVLLLDEVFSGLDRQSRGLVSGALSRLKTAGKAIIMVEHETEGLDFIDRTIRMKRGEALAKTVH